jgi:raffinose synthase
MWWMTQRMGTCGQEIPIETQFLLIEAHNGCDIDGGEEDQDGSTYAVLLPLLEGDFRAVLQGNDQNEIEICVESGMYSS